MTPTDHASIVRRGKQRGIADAGMLELELPEGADLDAAARVLLESYRDALVEGVRARSCSQATAEARA